MKRFGLTGLLLLVLVFSLAGCATDDSTGTSSTTKSSVPGEDVTGGSTLTPAAGASGAGANVRF